MQRQKTIAKWLVIILLCTLAVGAYILYDALYVGDLGGAAADDVTPPGENDDPTPSDPVEPDPPYYTELPRETQNFAGMSVGHVGGEGTDTVLDTVFTADCVYVFFRSSSEEYDCRGAGLYAAVFTRNSLAAVTRIGEATDSFGGAKQTADGVAAAVSDEKSGRLVVFSADGSVKGETALPSFDTAYLLLSGSVLFVFSSDGTALQCISVARGLTSTVIPFRLSGGYTVREGMVTADGIVLVAEKGEDLSVIEFSQNDGFNTRLTYNKTSFMQIVPLAGEEGAAFALLGKTAAGLRLAVFDAECRAEAETVVDGAEGGVLFGDGVSLTLVRTGVTETYCRHLDLISTSPTADVIGDVAAVRSSGNVRFYASVDGDGGMSVFVSADGGGFSSLMECGFAGGKLSSAVTDGKLLLSFSTSSTEGIFFENFGEADAYFVALPL